MIARPSSFEFEKIAAPDDWEHLMEALGGKLTHVFFGDEKIKSAASDMFSKSDMVALAPPKGFFGIHKVMMGAHESYGFNNNGDTFRREMLKRTHPTFVKHAGIYREHQNKDKRKSLGQVKASKFSDALDRVETVSWVEIDKALEEYEKARRGEEQTFSMAIKVPYDICSICRKKSPTMRDYCPDLKQNITRYVPSKGKYAFADNPDGCFIDESFVKRPADRTARYIEYRFHDDEKLMKAASQDRPVISGGQWAEFYHAEDKTASDDAGLCHEYAEELQKLAAAEQWFADTLHGKTGSGPLVKFAMHTARFSWDADARIPQSAINVFGALRPGTFMRKCASRGVLLPFAEFVSYAMGVPLAEVRQSEEYKAASECLPHLFRMMQAQEKTSACACRDADVDLFAPASRFMAGCDPADSAGVDRLMDEVHRDFSVEPAPVFSRGVTIISVKAGSENKSARPQVLHPWALMYGAYKLAAVRAISAADDERNADQIRVLCCSQNIQKNL